MLSFRPKLGSERSSEWRCFFCLHVRTGTLLLGTWHLMLHIIALGFLMAIMRNPDLLEELRRDSAALPDWGDVGPALPTPLSKIEPSPSPFTAQRTGFREHISYNDMDTGALVTVCTLVITLMLVYGAARGKPAHMLPFLCLQIFDFAVTVLTATGYLCYLRSIHRLVAETRRMPWRTELLRLPAPALAFIMLTTFTLAMLLKGYCISIVWRCYKYLTMRTHALDSLTPFVISSEGGVTLPTSSQGPYPPQPAPDYSSLLPDYEEAVKQTPPPSYRAATMMAAADPAILTPETPETPSPATSASPAASNTVVMLPQRGGHDTV